jgi:hypothetical protein
VENAYLWKLLTPLDDARRSWDHEEADA